jgi:hypothetical protein
MTKLLFLAWQDPESRRWFPIGRLTFVQEKYEFAYTQGAREAQEKANFQELHSFPELEKIYRSPELFPLFSNRLMRPSRPDYKHYIEWLNLPENEKDPIAILARSGGQKATDYLEVFACPEKDENGKYHVHFFTRGLRHYPDSLERVTQLKPGEPLLLLPEPTNIHDSQAILVSTQDQYKLGYCPRYLTPDIHQLSNNFQQEVKVLVERVNLAPTPIQLRLLCQMIAPWPDEFNPFSSFEYQPIVTKERSLTNPEITLLRNA